ncbi:MAG TPA: aminotransferase class IV [Thermoleophilaceae bacterium]|nr:aminotransferase class IV [Thermoleophilaceae bacterium]
MTRTPSAVSTAELACLDGTVAPAAETSIPVLDDGFLRGDGIFEAIRVYEGRAFATADHLDRLERSAKNLHLEVPVARAELEAEIADLVERRGGGSFTGALRIVITRGGRRLVMTEPLIEYPERARLAFVTYSPTRILDGVKSLSYAANMLASRIARERGFDDALLVTPHGRVLELPTSSIFWVAGDGQLCTPPLSDHILASITRDRVMRLTDAVERSCTTDDLLDASEAFVASSIREVQPVGTIEDRDFGEPGERTLAAAAAFRQHVEQELGRAS